MEHEKVVLDQDDMRRTLVRIAHEIVERNHAPQDLAIVGIHRRGALLARRIHALLGDLLDDEVPFGELDIAFYRDDVGTRPLTAPVVHASHVPFAVDGRTVVIVDDVLYTGRTTRAALDALIDFGRPRAIQLVVLVDRGHRELPIKADYVGKNVPTSRKESVQVRLQGEAPLPEVVLVAAPGDVMPLRPDAGPTVAQFGGGDPSVEVLVSRLPSERPLTLRAFLASDTARDRWRLQEPRDLTTLVIR